MAITWYSIDGQPTDATGSDGDLNFARTTRMVWGPKGAITAGSWAGTANSNIGPTGPGMLAGLGDPSPGYGQQGNGYTDVASGKLWLKSGTGWAQTGSLQVSNNLTPILQGAGPPNATTAPNVVVGQSYVDTQNSLFYPPATSAGFAGFTVTPINVVGPSGPAMQVQPALGNLAATWGPGSISNGGTFAAGVYQPSKEAGTGLAHTFTPFVNCSFSSVQITNYSSTGAIAYFYLADSAGSILFNVNSGNGVASGGVVNYTATGSGVALAAGKPYQWMLGRASAGSVFASINPVYTTPSTGPGVGYYPAANNLVPNTAITLSATNQYLGAAGVSGQTWYYKYPFASWLYGLNATIAGTGSVQLVLAYSGNNAAIWTSPAIVMSAKPTPIAFGPFPVSATYIVASNNVGWAVVGSGSVTSISVATAFGM